MAKSSSRSNLSTVLDPRGQPTAAVEPHPLAPRLDTIEGKTLYIVDVGFGGGWEFLEEAEGWFARNHPGVKTILEHKKGIMFVDEPEMWEEIKQNGDAVVFGVGGRDGCTASVAAHCRELEIKHGIPTAPVASARFAEYAAMDARNHGMKLRFSFPPYPLVGRPREVLRRYVEGNDAITGRPIMPQIVDALTLPLTEEEQNPTAERRAPRPRLLQPDTEENLHRLFLENGWTDGAPIVLPTEERVAHMLAGTAADPNDVVGRMTITIDQERLEYTVEKVAVNAVMAGAGPEHLPVILALAASQEPSMPSSTTSFGRMAVVNGPIREEIGMNCGLGALSPFNHANTVIGRAWTLMTINLADSRLGETFMGSTGNTMNYNNMLLAENEERSVWEPFHVRKGFRKDESTVSFFQGWSAINSMGAAGCRRPAQEEMLVIMQAFPCIRGALTLVMDPLVARHLKEQGFADPAQLSGYLSENFRMTAEQFWGSDVIYSLIEPNARNGIEPFASWLKLPKDALIAPYTSPETINAVVAGGETQALWLTTDMWHTQTVSIDKWRPKGWTYEEDEQTVRRRQALRKRHAAALKASGYD